MVAPEPTCPDSSGCKQVIHTGGTWGGDLSSTTSRKKSPPGGTCGHFDQIKFKEEFSMDAISPSFLAHFLSPPKKKIRAD